MTFGLSPSQTTQAGTILSTLARDWRELVAGSEGWLTSPERRGLHRWPVAWGDQDSMVSTLPSLLWQIYSVDGTGKLKRCCG
jgi:hypothetical protein